MPFGSVQLKRRRTKIIATLGPATAEPAVIEDLIVTGVDVFRMNMSHGTHESHRTAYQTVRKAAEVTGAPVAVLADLCGPKIRVGRFAGGRVELADGDTVTVTTREVMGEPGLVPCQYAGLAGDVRPGSRLLLADGLLELRVKSVRYTEMECAVIHGGVLTDGQGMNVPDTEISAVSLTDKDRDDARFAIDLGVDFLAQSFVRAAADVEQLRSLVQEGRRPVGIIAKIERREALDDLDAILHASDGIMVARGDLGAELPLEQVPVIQRRLVAEARAWNKPSIVATQMLESMIEQPRPTRAEVSDVSTAVFSGADAVMLSAETAIGRYPVRAVQIMDGIARQVEGHLWTERGFRTEGEDVAQSLLLHEAVARSTAQLSRDLQVRAIVVFSGTGVSARALSSARPASPVVAVTSSEPVFGQLNLLWGTVPSLVSEADLDRPQEVARYVVMQMGLAETGHPILAVGGMEGPTDNAEITVLTV
jgi:pyruvate kinase